MSAHSLFAYRARRRTERIYKDNGWSPQLSWPVPRAEGKPLAFQLRVPIGIELVDLATLVERTADATGSLGAGAAALERAAGAAGAFLVAAIANVPEEGKPQETVATLTVALAEIPGPPDVERFAIKDSESTVRSDVQVTALSDKVTRVHRLSLESLTAEDEPVPMLVVQYLLETRYGALVMAFSTARTDMMGEWGLKLFADIMKMAVIGERPAPY